MQGKSFDEDDAFITTNWSGLMRRCSANPAPGRCWWGAWTCRDAV